MISLGSTSSSLRPLGRFQVVTARMTSFKTLPGDAFTNNVERKASPPRGREIRGGRKRERRTCMPLSSLCKGSSPLACILQHLLPLGSMLFFHREGARNILAVVYTSQCSCRFCLQKGFCTTLRFHSCFNIGKKNRHPTLRHL